MNPPSVDVRQKMIDDYVVQSDKIFIGADPLNLASTYVTLTDAGGSANPRWLRDVARLQVRVRARTNNYPEGYELIRNIRDYLLGKKPFQVNSVIYKRFVITSDILFLGYDDNNRPSFSVNFDVGIDYTDDVGTNRDVIA